MNLLEAGIKPKIGDTVWIIESSFPVGSSYPILKARPATVISLLEDRLIDIGREGFERLQDTYHTKNDAQIAIEKQYEKWQ